MPNLTNPAGRLHALLTAFKDVANPQHSIIATWAMVFEAESDEEVISWLCEAAGLIGEIDKAISTCGDDDQRALFSHHVLDWAQPVIFPAYLGNQTPSQGSKIVNVSALLALGSVSAYLSAAMPHDNIPAEDNIYDLRRQIQDSIDCVIVATGIPEIFKKQLLDHLYAIAWALDHLRIAGPEGVIGATERLLGWSALNRPAPKSDSHGLVTKTLKTVGFVWATFKGGPAIHSALEAWHSIWVMLPSGQSHSNDVIKKN